MASPESNRIGGPRPSGSGVKGLLAMFEKSSSSPSSSTAPGNGLNPANPASRDQSPGPRPLGKVRTSFVAVTGNSGPMFGLQKAPFPTSPISPAAPIAEDLKLVGEPSDNEKVTVENEPMKEEVATTTNGRHMLDESNLKKHDLESQIGYTTPLKAIARLSPSPEDISIIQEYMSSEKPLDLIPAEKDEVGLLKSAKTESNSKSTDSKAGPPPKSPTKSMFSKTNKLAPTNGGKSLTLPLSKSTTTSPLPSPAFAPKSPIRSAAPSSSSASKTKSPAVVPNTSSSSTKSRNTASTSATIISPTASTTLVAPKSRSLATAIEKAKNPVAKRVETKSARESNKPPTIRSSAFAPTSASAAKFAADQKAAARSRPPSSASVRNRSPPSSAGMRRGNSGMSSRPGRKDQRSPQRPQTSAAIRNPNRTSVGSLQGVPGATGGDFLSRMMRPTTASAGKVSDKKPGTTNPPPKRSASVTSTSRRREKSLPPPMGRLQKQKTGENPKLENTSTKTAESEETSREVTEVQDQIQEAIDLGKEASSIDVPEAKAEVEAQELEDGNQSPTTTTSSTTLVHECEGKDDSIVLTKE